MTGERRFYTRRGFLFTATGAIAAGADTLLVTNTKSLGLTRPLWEMAQTNTLFESVAYLKQDLNRKTGVAFLNPSAELNRILEPDTPCNRPDLAERVIAWDSPALKVAGNLMAQIPESLYAPAVADDGTRHYLEMALVARPAFDFRTLSTVAPSTRSQHQSHEEGRHIIVISRSRFSVRPGEVDGSQRLLLHELTHYKTTQKLQYYIDRICVPLGIPTLEALQQTFDSELSTVTKSDSDDCGTTTGEASEKLVYKSKMGYGATKFGEFFSVGSEYFCQGRDKFVRTYRKCLGEDNANELYLLIRENIFENEDIQLRAA